MKQMFTRARGFTLIELLVVIAIIGILASVVLASLNSARDKGEDSAVKQQMNSLRAQAEITYDDDNRSYAAVCTDAGTQGLLDTNGDGTNDITCQDVDAGWAASEVLSTGEFFCVDYTGVAGEYATDPAISDTNLTCE